MATSVASRTTSYRFDDRNIEWRELGDFKHFVVSVFAVDEEKNVADFIVKFAANEQIFLHRHLALTHTFVIDGEHILYEPDGKIREATSTSTCEPTRWPCKSLMRLKSSRSRKTAARLVL